MMRGGFLAFGLAFLVSLGFGNVGCEFGSDCDCPATPPQPATQAPIEGLTISSYGEDGNEVASEVEPDQGSIEVTGNAVVIRYRQGAADHEVRYTVLGP
jgi:hypothetical protein